MWIHVAYGDTNQINHCLVVWNIWIIFPHIGECHHPNWLTPIFQRGRSTTNQLPIKLKSHWDTLGGIMASDQPCCASTKEAELADRWRALPSEFEAAVDRFLRHIQNAPDALSNGGRGGLSSRQLRRPHLAIAKASPGTLLQEHNGNMLQVLRNPTPVHSSS